MQRLLCFRAPPKTLRDARDPGIMLWVIGPPGRTFESQGPYRGIMLHWQRPDGLPYVRRLCKLR